MSGNIKIENNVLTASVLGVYPNYKKGEGNGDGASRISNSHRSKLVLSTKDIKHFMPCVVQERKLFPMSPTKTLEAIHFINNSDVHNFLAWCKDHVDEA